MTPTKLLIGQILIVLAIMVAGVWAATQWAASMLAYQPELGTPWFALGELALYRPWALFGWWYHYACHGVRADPKRQGRRPRRHDAARLDRLGRHPRTSRARTGG